VSTSTATLAWTAGTDAISGVHHYDVYLGGAYRTSSTSTSAVLASLSPSTLYSATVVAVDAAGNRASASSPFSFVTDNLVDTPFTTVLGVTPLSPNGANDWYVTTPTVTLVSLPMPGGTTFFMWDPPGGSYSTYVATITPPAGVSTLNYSTHDPASIRTNEPTRQASFRVDTETPPTPSVTATATSDSSIRLSWPALTPPPSGIAHYAIYIDGSLAGTATASPYDAVGLHAHTTYGFQVAAISSAGTTSALSATVSETTPYAPLPAAPTIVYAKAPTGGYSYVNWQASSDTMGATNYRVWRSSDGVTYSVVATTTGGLYENTYIDRGLRSSTRYWYAISTLDMRGESSLSSTAAAVWPSIAPTTGPAEPPVNLTAIGSDHAVALVWQASPNPAVVGYEVLRAPASLSATITTLTAVPATGTAFFDMTAVNGEPYYYSVVPVDASAALGTRSLEKLGRAVEPPNADQPQPHAFGNDSGCLCHSGHEGYADGLISIPDRDKSTVCESCHTPAQALGEFLDPLAKSRHSLAATASAENPFTCNTCHVPLYYYTSVEANLLRVNGNSPCVAVTDTPPGNGFCYSCHGTGSTLPEGDMTAFENSGHNNVNAPPTGANVKCDACHESHSSRNESLNTYSGYMMCMQCHTSSSVNPDEPDILSRLTLNPDSNAKHPLLPQDQTTGARLQCQNCHNTHTTSQQYPLVDPHNPSPTGTWITPRTDEKAFCFRCHDGLTLPTSAETTPWANAVTAESSATTVTDIKLAYDVNVHGLGQQSGPTTTTAYLRPDMGYAYGDVLECRACHDPHGTVNNFALRQDVVSASGNKTINGVVVAKVPGGGYDFRFFCNTCHLFDSATHDLPSMAGTDTTTFPMNCMACHRHVRTNGIPSTRL
jgi:predicted CXXCH cytochrome family protein